MIYSKIGWGGLTVPPAPLKKKTLPTAKFPSQGDAHMRTDAQIKFLYFPLSVYPCSDVHGIPDVPSYVMYLQYKLKTAPSVKHDWSKT